MIGSLGGAELVLVLVLALILFGPRRLPQIGRTIGRAMAEFRGAANEFRSSLEREVEIQEIQQLRTETEAVGREMGDTVRGIARGPSPPRTADEPGTGRSDVEERDDGSDPRAVPPAQS